VMSESIPAVLGEFRARARWEKPVALQDLVAGWSKFVQEVEIGYALSIYDYVNDLGGRELLAELIDRVSDSDQKEVFSAVQPWDERFRFATEPLGEPLPGAPDDPRWWWVRRPRVCVGELKDDLEAEELT
jgi:hypothetical protein